MENPSTRYGTRKKIFSRLPGRILEMKYYLRTACGIILGTMACVQGLGATAHHDSCIQEGWKEEKFPSRFTLTKTSWIFTIKHGKSRPDG